MALKPGLKMEIALGVRLENILACERRGVD